MKLRYDETLSVEHGRGGLRILYPGGIEYTFVHTVYPERNCDVWRMSVVNALIVALASKRQQALSETFDKLERIWEEYNVYEKRRENT